ncbi:hypothetical protein CPB86DRAFT_849593 [Serendipita vermifera]|nr:hypothetical protein CPB86DRAFT_849593 [Serendipita vermifera]
MEYTRGYLHPFLNASLYDSGVGEEIRTLVELKMCRFSYYIRSTTSWWERLSDEHDAVLVRKEWTALAQQEAFLHPLEGEEKFEDSSPSSPNPVSPSFLTLLKNAPPLTDSQIKWVLDELPAYAKRITLENHCQPACFERIWEADRALSPKLLQAFHDEIQKRYLYDDAARASCIDDTAVILDLIHPSDFPMISDSTFCWDREEDTTLGIDAKRKLVQMVLGRPVGSIPTDFNVSNDGKGIERLGYINNLPPTPPFSRMNKLLTVSIQTFIPLFERTLTSLHRSNHLLLHPRIALKDKPSMTNGDEEMWREWDRAVRVWAKRRNFILPDVPSTGFGVWGKGHPILGRDGSEMEMHEVSLRGRRIQLFTKLTRLELSPDHPRFDGGQWSCEGCYEDHIVACGSVVLDSHNVTEGSIAFRMAVTRPSVTCDDPDSACLAYWGKQRGSHLNQEIGSVVLRKGRCITYPNLYQHRLSPFELVDKSTSGYRTTLQIMLVDPEVPILSSTDVPPQQASWAMQALMDSLNNRVPVEIIQRIVDFAVHDLKCLIPDESRWSLRESMEKWQFIEKERVNMYFEMSF